MPETIRIQPDELRRAAADFAAAAEKVQAVLRTLQTNADSKGNVWGQDRTGAQFANGPQGYLRGRTTMYAALQGNVDRCIQYAAGLRKTVDSFKRAEATNTAELRH